MMIGEVIAGVLMVQTDDHVAEEMRELGEFTTNADSIRERLKPVYEVSHLTVEYRQACVSTSPPLPQKEPAMPPGKRELARIERRLITTLTDSCETS